MLARGDGPEGRLWRLHPDHRAHHSPGFRYDLLDKIGMWGSDTASSFRNVRVPVAYTIGDIGRGFQQQMMQFQTSAWWDASARSPRAGHLGADAPMGRAARPVRQPLAKMQVTQFKFVEILTQITAARETDLACIRELNPASTPRSGSRWRNSSAAVSRDRSLTSASSSRRYGYMKESVAGRAFFRQPPDQHRRGSAQTMIHYLAKHSGSEQVARSEPKASDDHQGQR